MKEYNPFRTAINRSSLSLPMSVLLNNKMLFGKCLDYGCGRGTDVKFCKELGINIEGYDKYNEAFNVPSLLKEHYDVVVCNYVFNVIPNLKEHEELLGQLRELGDNICVAVRSDIKAIRDNWEYIKDYDCYKTSTNTYQRFYNEEMIKEYFGEVKFLLNNNNLKLFYLQTI